MVAQASGIDSATIHSTLPHDGIVQERAGFCLLYKDGSPHWKHSELMFERRELIPDLRRLLKGQDVR